MASFVRLSPDRHHLDDSVRVLTPEAYSIAVAADGLLADARARADTIAQLAQADHEAEKRRGYDEGMAAGRAEIAEQMVSLVDRSVAYLAKAERDVADTVLVCLRKILGEFSEDDLVLRAARAGLSKMRNEARVTLRVRPEAATPLRRRVGELLHEHTDIGFLEIVADGSMAEGGCRLETELGVIDASIEFQLQALEKAFAPTLGAPPTVDPA